MKVFISHLSRDKAVVAELRNALSASGFDVLDAGDVIQPGESISEKHITQMMNEADAVIPVMSGTEDRGPWTNMELALAMAKTGMRIIPVATSREAVIPPLLADRLYLLLDKGHLDEQAANRLIAALKAPVKEPGESTDLSVQASWHLRSSWILPRVQLTLWISISRTNASTSYISPSRGVRGNDRPGGFVIHLAEQRLALGGHRKNCNRHRGWTRRLLARHGK